MLKISAANTQTLNPTQIQDLYSIVINAYKETEKEVWGPNYVRVSFDQFLTHVEKGEFLVAQLDEEVVGGVRVFELKDKVWSFSLLGASFNHSGMGIGRALIKASEEKAKANNSTSMHIEVLRAEGIEVASKQILSDWYQRLGYDFIKTIDVFEVYNDAEKWARLVNPSVFDCYRKELI